LDVAFGVVGEAVSAVHHRGRARAGQLGRFSFGTGYSVSLKTIAVLVLVVAFFYWLRSLSSGANTFFAVKG
jgi:hypothetical protein